MPMRIYLNCDNSYGGFEKMVDMSPWDIRRLDDILNNPNFKDENGNILVTETMVDYYNAVDKNSFKTAQQLLVRLKTFAPLQRSEVASLNCPFCGSGAHEFWTTQSGDIRLFKIGCVECGIYFADRYPNVARKKWNIRKYCQTDNRKDTHNEHSNLSENRPSRRG